MLKRLGVDVSVADIQPDPKALTTLRPYIKDFIHIKDESGIAKLRQLAATDPFSVMDVSTWGETHVFMSVLLQDICRFIVNTKPVDTNLDLLRSINGQAQAGNPVYRNFVDRFLVHDHYGSRWVVQEAARRMPSYHAEEGRVTEVQIYILEHRSVTDEVHRLQALQDGMCFDLLPHAFRVLYGLMAAGSTWEYGGLRFTRERIDARINGGIRERSILCPLEPHAETFAAVSIEANDVVCVNKGMDGHIQRYPFECLMVIGKGVDSHRGGEVDSKGVYIKFETGRTLEIDLDSQRMHEPTGNVVLPPEDVLHRGINLPLMEFTKCLGSDNGEHRSPQHIKRFFQPFGEATRAAELIDVARRLPWLERAYIAGIGCAELVNQIPEERWGARRWHLPDLPNIHIGLLSETTVSIP